MSVCRAGQPASTLLPAMQHATASRVSSTRAPVPGWWQRTGGPEGPGRAPCLLQITAQQSTCRQAAYMHDRLDRDSLGRRASPSGHWVHPPPQDYLLAHNARPTAHQTPSHNGSQSTSPACQSPAHMASRGSSGVRRIRVGHSGSAGHLMHLTVHRVAFAHTLLPRMQLERM